jgi:hypothetical protein
MSIIPLARVAVDVSSARVATTPVLDRIAVWQQHDIAVLDGNLAVTGTFRVPATIRCLALSPTGDRLGFATDDAIGVMTLAGEVGIRVPWTAGAQQVGCTFSPDGRLFWVASNAGLLVVDVTQGRVIVSQSLMFLRAIAPDTNVLLTPHPEGECVALIVGAGAEFSGAFWVCHEEGRVDVFRDPAEQDSGLVWFSPAGDEYLALAPGAIYRKRFPTGELLGELRDDVFPEDEDGFVEDEFGLTASYVSDDAALCNTNEGDLLLVRLSPMGVRSHLTLQVPAGMKNPPGGMAHDFAYSRSGHLLTACYVPRQTLLVLWDVSDIVGSSRPISPLQPYTRQLRSQGRTF